MDYRYSYKIFSSDNPKDCKNLIKKLRKEKLICRKCYANNDTESKTCRKCHSADLRKKHVHVDLKRHYRAPPVTKDFDSNYYMTFVKHT